MSDFSPIQKRVAKLYCNGDMQHVAPSELHDCGDTLFTFLMLECTEGEGCDSIDVALYRIQSAAEQLSSLGYDLSFQRAFERATG